MKETTIEPVHTARSGLNRHDLDTVALHINDHVFVFSLEFFTTFVAIMTADASTFGELAAEGVEKAAVIEDCSVSLARRATFTKSDVTRVFKAAKAAGEVVCIEIHPDGRIVATPLAKRHTGEIKNEWDDLP